MKMLALSIMLLALNAHAKSEAVICEKLRDQAYDSCAESLCKEAEADGQECYRDGDFHVAASECAWEEHAELVEIYNLKHPNKKISCED